MTIMAINFVTLVSAVLLWTTCLAQSINNTSDGTTVNKDSTISGSTASNTSTTTAKPNINQICAALNASCDDCVGHTDCLWCSSKKPKCIPYPKGDIIPGSDTCDLSDARWGVCWVNYEILLICMGVLGGVILIVLVCCIYCCCCRTNKTKQRKKFQKEDEKLEREREERKLKHDERKAERKAKYDEIRKKYGLIKDDNPYQRFEDS